MKNRIIIAALAAGVASYFAVAQTESVIKVQTDSPKHRVSPVLWGIFFEDINLSADGGIYPEQIRNRSFEDSDRLEHWRLELKWNAKADATIDSSRPLNPLNRRSLRLRITEPGEVLLVNDGYWGVSVIKDEGYNISLYARSTDGFRGPVRVMIQSQTGEPIASCEINGLGDNWRKYTFQVKPSATDHKARFVLAVNQRATVWFDMVSLMPQNTFKGNGLRIDLCKMLADLKPSFIRFPGGCWVEGDDMEHMYNWKHTIGNIEHRRPLWNLWRYWATHGLGFHEYLQLAEDLNAEPLFCINVGMSHREVVPMDQMGQWVQDALDAIEYANGPVDSVWGSLRAKNGHPAPFNLKYLEIGNENGGPAYNERWALFYKAIKSKYPNIQLVANVWGGYPTDPMPDIIDEHYYNSPEFFMRQATKYDSYSRKGPKVFLGEYAVTRGCGNGNLKAAIGEAAFMTGIERNSDVVVMAAYAPLFANVNHKRWNPDLIYFDNHRVYGTPSYYVQKMFSENRGDYVLPVEIQSRDAVLTPKGGAIGVGTWLTQAEYKDIKVLQDDKVVFSWDFANGTEGWKYFGDGEWQVVDGALRQNRIAENVRAIYSGKLWTNYTYTLRARKLGGAEGFLILFNVRDENEKSWWNIGGWGNRRHGIEIGGIIGNEVNGRIETGKWYDIKIEVKNNNIKCYLDGKLIHDVGYPAVKSLYASATKVEKTGETILKVVNTSDEPQTATLRLDGKKNASANINAIVLTSNNPADENSFDEPLKVSPKTNLFKVDGNSFKHTFPANSVTILRVP